MDNRPSYPPRGRPPARPATFPRTSRPPGPAPARPTPRPEDAQPSEAVTSNRRAKAPPSVVPAAQTTLAGGWGTPNQATRPPGRVRGGPYSTNGGPSGPRRAGPAGSAVRLPNRPRPQTTAGGWSSSNATPLESDADGTRGGMRKGKERQWGTPVASLSSTNAATLPTVSTPVPVPMNPRPKIYVSQLPPSITEQELRSVFSPYGEIETVTINVKPQTNHAFAHVTYSTVRSASDAITSLHLQPFPSIDGVGPSRPIRVAFESASELERRLFRERETPESSQVVVKKEIPSPVKRIVDVADQPRGGPPGPNGTATTSKSGSSSSSRSDSSRYATPEFEHHDAHDRARSNSLTTRGEGSWANRQGFPPFIDPPYLSYESISFEPTRAGTLDYTTPLACTSSNPRRYSVSYHFSRRFVGSSANFDVLKEFARWIQRSLTVPGDEGWRFVVDADSIQLTAQGEARDEVGTGHSDGEGEILTFVIEVMRKALGELERETPWTKEEEEQCKLRTAQMKREIRAQLDTSELLSDISVGSKRYPYIEPPALSFDGVPFPAARPGTIDPSAADTSTYSLVYIYSLELFPSITSTLTAGFESRLRESFESSSIRLVCAAVEDPSLQEGRKDGNAEGSDGLTFVKGEGALKVTVEFTKTSPISTYGRTAGWTGLDWRKAQEELEGMRKVVKDIRGSTAAAQVSHHPEPGEPSIPQPAQAGRPQEGLQADGTVVERIPLPLALIGEGPDQLRKQILFRVEEVKKRSLEGKIVLASSIEGNCISINYFIDDSAGSSSVVPPPSSTRPPPTEGPASINQSTTSRESEDHEMAAGDDIKPVVSNVAEEEMEIDQLDYATPELNPSEVVRFPLGILKNSRADSIETYQAATAFIDEYFRRFDSSRSSLEGLYTRNAFFSLKVDTTTPRRLTRSISLFSRQWFQSANKFASTPIAITNCIRRLPAGSHNLSTMLFNARTIPEFHLNRRQRAPVLLHLTGEFEEFPDKIVRRFERTFVLVPRVASWEVMDGPGEFMIHSDQLLIGHKVEGEPKELAVLDPPFRPSSPTVDPTTRPPVVVPHSQVQASSDTGRPTFVQPFAAPSPPPPHRTPAQLQPQQPQTDSAPRPQPQPRSVEATSTPAGPSRTSEKRPRASDVGIAHHVNRRLSEAELLVLSDTESAASRRLSSQPPTLGQEDEGEEDDDEQQSRSPEVSRPSKRPHLATGIQGRRTSNAVVRTRSARESSSASSVSDSNAAVDSSAAVAAVPRPTSAITSQPRKTITTRKANGAPSTFKAAATSSEVETSGGRLAQSLPEEIQRFIAEQVAREVQEKMRNAARNSPEASEAVKKKGNKGKDKDKDKEAEKSKEKKKKEREKKEKFVNGLGTGLPPGDGRIVIPGIGHSILHGFDGRSNKLRGMITTADANSFLAVSFLGDIAEWSMQPQNSLTASSMTKLYSSTQDKYRVDDFTYNRTKDTLIVGYLGAKEGREMASPPNQVVLYKRDFVGPSVAKLTGHATNDMQGVHKLTETRLDEAPHVNGGVSAIMALPSNAPTDRLRFVTGGEDKKIYLWTRKRSTQEVKLDKFRTEHTALITSLAYLETSNELVSGGKDRRVVTYDLERKESTWQTSLSAGVMSVSPVACDPNLILSRLTTPSQQFLLHDRRVAPTSPPILTFGYDLAPHRSSNGTLVPTNMGRYSRGDQIDTVVAFPDNDQGVKLWDLRQLKSEIVKKQDLAGLGRSKVVQATFRGRNELCLMELAHFTRLSIKG
ncbi:hypothetical protein JCM11491_001924 [Sporobolomyces phaffii]